MIIFCGSFISVSSWGYTSYEHRPETEAISENFLKRYQIINTEKINKALKREINLIKKYNPSNRFEMSLLHIDNKGISYYTPGYSNTFRLARSLLHLETTARKIGLPSGWYWLSTADGIDQSQMTPDMTFPILAFSGDKSLVQDQRIILIPDHLAMMGYDDLKDEIYEANKKNPWHKKKHLTFWRGSTTGFPQREEVQDIYQLPRTLWVNFCSVRSDLCDAGFTDYVQKPNSDHNFKHQFPLKSYVAPKNSLDHKFLLLIDGNAASYSRSAWAFYSNSVVIKQKSRQIQWYDQQMRPGVTHLEIEHLDELEKLMSHSDTYLQNIARNGTHLAEKVFSKVSIELATQSALVRYQSLHHPLLSRNKKNDSEVKGDWVELVSLEEDEVYNQVLKYARDHGIYASMTTSPLRLKQIYQILDQLDFKLITAFYLNIPKVFPRTGETYDLTYINQLKNRYGDKFKVNWLEKDLGPASKILPALEKVDDHEAIIVSLDDDHLYPIFALSELAFQTIKHDAAVSAMGQNIEFWSIDNTDTWLATRMESPEENLAPRDVLEGFALIVYKKKFLNIEKCLKLLNIDDHCRFSDDLILSYVLAQQGVPRYLSSTDRFNFKMIEPKAYGFYQDALHQGRGIIESIEESTADFNFIKYRKAAKLISDF